MDTKRALFLASFDPITLGHTDIINRGLALFDEIIIAGNQVLKKIHVFFRTAMAFIEAIYKDKPKIKVASYGGLTVDFCQSVDAEFILRGLRNPADFEFESHCPHQSYTVRN